MVSAGHLRERVTFSARQFLSDGYGNEESEFVDIFTVWARIMPLKGGERVLADRLTGVQPVVITVRYSEDTKLIEPGWRAVDRNGVVYNITGSANMDEKKQYFDILATAGEAA